MSEEQRAADYRASLIARARYQVALKRSLAGSRSARLGLQERWQPIVDWLAERNDPDGGEEDEPGLIANG